MNRPDPPQAQAVHPARPGPGRDPFGPLDPRDIHEWPAFAQRLNLLQHLVQDSDLILVVEGKAGSGKTTLLERLLQQAPEHWRVCRLDGPSLEDAGALRLQVLESFDLSTEGGAEQQEARLHEYFAGLRQSGQLPVVVVDDAHAVPPPVLARLLSLGTGAEDGTARAARLLLTGEPELESRLREAAGEALPDTAFHRLGIPPLDQEHASAYLRHHLTSAGWQGDFPFSREEILALWKRSQGLPGALNEEARRALASKAATSGADAPQPPARKRGGRIRRWAGIGAAAGLAVILGGVLLMQDRINAWLGGAGGMARKEVPLPLPPAPAQTPPPAGKPSPWQPADARPSPAAPPEPPPAPAADAAPPAGPVHGKTPPEVHDRTRNQAGPAIAPEEDGEAALQVPATGGPPNGGAAAKTGTPSAEPPASARAPPTPESVPTTAPGADTVQHAATSPPATPLSTRVHGEAWLLKQKPSAYAIQLLGVQRENTLREFAAGIRLAGPLASFRTRHRGKDWYVLVYGLYPSKEAARAAIARLPAALRRNEPWPRRLADIQRAIRDARKDGDTSRRRVADR